MDRECPRFNVNDKVILEGVIKKVETNEVSGGGWLYLVSVEGERHLIGLPAEGTLVHERAVRKAIDEPQNRGNHEEI